MRRRYLLGCVFILLVAVLGGCAHTPPPDEALAVSRSAISDAQSAGAYEYAPLELQQAQMKLDQAQAAMREDENTLARRLAEEAMADAKLAELKARSAKAQRAVNELQEGIQILQQQLEREG